ncbi:MAG: SDR family oxidoreductase [Silicimonas sp.]|nr:SDR family oxidoreductase [Silicimonas sp.]
MSDLTGQVALVTGAAQGIGAAVVAALAEAGAQVIASDINPIGVGAQTRAIPCDVSDADDVARLFYDIAAHEERLDCVVNAAGILSEASILETTPEAFDRTIGVNLRGSFLIAQGAARMMVPAGRGRILLVASELAYLGRADFSAYCASKAGVVGLTRSLAHELAPHIQVNTIAPGPVDTPMLALENMSQDWIDKEFDVPLKRIGRPEEIGALARFLCGPDAGFFTGQTLSPNGGAVMI